MSLLGEPPVHQVGGPFIEIVAGKGIDTIIVGVGVDTAEAKAAGERLNVQVVEVNSFLLMLSLFVSLLVPPPKFVYQYVNFCNLVPHCLLSCFPWGDRQPRIRG